MFENNKKTTFTGITERSDMGVRVKDSLSLLIVFVLVIIILSMTYSVYNSAFYGVIDSCLD